MTGVLPPRDRRRIPEVLDMVRLVWQKYPDLRLTQLLATACGTADPFYVEEPELLEGLKRMMREPV
jgi:hypothetical protein